MATIICTKCFRATEVPVVSGDNSAYVCNDCAELANQEAYKAEIESLEKKENKTESEVRRIEFLRKLIRQ